LQKGRCKKIALIPFLVIPAKAGIQYLSGLRNFLDPGFHRGDDLDQIFSHLQGDEGGFNGFSKALPVFQH
jgi:hypothetical protein